jgi:tetratricopeptide (TPR) repeat protein/transcriptional regulator with XRE-family HTH domain
MRDSEGKRMEVSGSDGLGGGSWAAFVKFLSYHMDEGTSGAAKPPSLRWTQKELAEATGISEGGRTTVKRESISAYVNMRDLPEDLHFTALARVLFGDKPEHAEKKQQFKKLWLEARREKREKEARARKQAATRRRPNILPPTRCFGREAELNDLLGALLGSDCATALVMGGGGMGKTTLTRQAAIHPDIIKRFGARRFEAELYTARSAADMQSALARALGAEPTMGLNAICKRLGAAPALLLLDNLESPWDAEPDKVEKLLTALAATPKVALVASILGREAPRAPAWKHKCLLRPLPFEDARQIFLNIATTIRDDDKHLEPLLKELGGIPLAVELIAWQAQLQEDLVDIWVSWQETGEAKDQRDGNHRHSSLARSIAVSLSSPRLDEAGRRVFRLLGALPAGLSREDQRALSASEGARKLLTVGLGHVHDDRLDLLPPIRRHAFEHHPCTVEETMGWVQHFLTLVRRFDSHPGPSKELGEAVSRLASEIPNLEAAFRLAAREEGLREVALGALYLYRLICLLTGQGGAALGPLAASCGAANDQHGEAECTLWMAQIAANRSDYAAARDGYEKALPTFRKEKNRLFAARCIEGLAWLDSERSDDEAAQKGFKKALRVYSTEQNASGQARCIEGIAHIALARLDYAAAEEGFSTARSIFLGTKNEWAAARCTTGLAHIALRCSDLAAAKQLYEDALRINHTIGFLRGKADCLEGLAQIALRDLDHAKAQAGFEEALPIYRDVRSVKGEGLCLGGLGEVAAAKGDRAAGRRLLTEAIDLFESLGSKRYTAWAREVLTRIES